MFAAPTQRSLMEPSNDEVRLVAVLVSATILYLAYHLLIDKKVVARLFPTESVDDARLRTRVAFWRRWLGAVLFGVLPALPVVLFMPGGLGAVGLALGDVVKGAWMSGAFVAFLLPFVVFQARRASFRELYPEVRMPLVGRTAIWSAISWAAYLVAYELFFRGFLVLGIAPIVGPLPAIAISLMGYVFVHLGKHPGEAVGTLVSGTWFGIVALESGSVLGPILAHLAMALATDYFASRRLSSPK